MELQWPLILFTTFVAWSAGLFGTQAVLALKGEGRKAQTPCWIVAAVLLVVGGISVFFHLQHADRIFNGFGHLTSGITQELIAIVVLAVIAVIYLVFLRRSGEGRVPAWVAVLSIIVSVVLVIVMAHSYMMAARPAWDSVLWVAYVLGNACILGPASAALICAVVKEPSGTASLSVLVGSIVNVVTTLLYAVSLQFLSGSFTTFGYYSDPTKSTEPMLDMSSVSSVFTGDLAPLMWIGVIIVGAVVPLVAALVQKHGASQAAAAKGGEAAAVPSAVWMAVAVVAAVVGAICMRVVFYNLGYSVFMIY